MAKVAVDLNKMKHADFYDLVAKALRPGRGKFANWNDFYDAVVLHLMYTDDRLDIIVWGDTDSELAADIDALVRSLNEDGVGGQVSCGFEPKPPSD